MAIRNKLACVAGSFLETLLNDEFLLFRISRILQENLANLKNRKASQAFWRWTTLGKLSMHSLDCNNVYCCFIGPFLDDRIINFISIKSSNCFFTDFQWGRISSLISPGPCLRVWNRFKDFEFLNTSTKYKSSKEHYRPSLTVFPLLTYHK